MVKEKDILQDLEKEIEETYEILLQVLSKIKKIINALKSNRKELGGYVYEYIRLYKMARGIRLLLAVLDRRIEDDKRIESIIRKDEDYLDGAIKKYGINSVKIKELVKNYSRWGDDTTVEQTINEISRLFKALTLWTQGEFRRISVDTHKETLEEYSRLGIIHLHHEIITILTRFMVKVKIILGLLGIGRDHLRKINRLIKQKIVPIMKEEIEFIRINSSDRRVLNQAIIIEQNLKLLESMV